MKLDKNFEKKRITWKNFWRSKSFVNIFVSFLIIFISIKYILIPIYYIFSDTSSQKLNNVLISSDNYSNIEFYHFSKMPITYSLLISAAGNDEYEINRIKWALRIIEESSDNLIQFKEVGEYDNSDLIIFGTLSLEDVSNNFVTEGFASITENEDNRITQSEVVLYPTKVSGYGGTTRTEKDDTYIYTITEYELRESVSWSANDCKDFPNTEIHEILHAFGFGHNLNNSYSIMFPILHRIQTCKTKEIDKEIVSCLKYIYSNGKVNGDCSDLNMYPWIEEQEPVDFIWDSLPVSYSVANCNENQKWNIQKAEKVIEEYVGYNLYNFDYLNGKIRFKCYDSFDDILLNKETDFWDTTVYFPAAQPYYYYNKDNNIDYVEILLFAQNRTCGGIEVHELLHGLGLRNHDGPWMEYETEMCDLTNMVLSKKTKEKVKELYSLNASS